MSEILPHNLDAERYVLGSIMLDDARMGQVAGALTAGDFSIEKNRRIFGCMCELHEVGEHIDTVTVAEWLSRREQLESVDGLTYLVSLDDGLPHIENLEAYVRSVQDNAMLRQIIFKARDIARQAQGAGRPDELSDALAALADGARRTAGALRRPISTAELAATVPVERLLGYGSEARRGLALPWPSLQQALCGLLPGQLILVAGHTSTGKTSMALQIAAKAALDTAVVVFSLEMDPERLYRRLTLQRAGVDGDRVRHNALDEAGVRSLHGAASFIQDLPIYLDETSHTVAAMILHIRRVRAMLRGRQEANQPVMTVGLVVVDYLQLLQGMTRHDSRAQEVGALARALKLAAQEFSLPIVLLSQFRRQESGSRPRNPEIFDLKESGDIENHADVVLLIQPDLKQAAGETPIRINLHIAKQREGPRHVDIPLLFSPQNQRFSEEDVSGT